MALTTNIIGAGKLGKTIGHLLAKNKIVQIEAICNTTKASSLSAIEFIGKGVYCPTINALPAADLTFITTPDDLISSVCRALSTANSLKPESIVVHCSGALTSDELIAAKNKDCYVANVHPMCSFAKPELLIHEYNGTYCAIEGDEEGLRVVEWMFNKIGSITYKINKKQKVAYHMAGVFASNYLITLSKQALSCLKEAGMENEIAMRVITTLMQNTVTNLKKTLSPEQSLTGPIQRGDLTTIKSHLQSLAESEQRKLYSTLGKATIPLTALHENKKEELIQLFSIEPSFQE